MEIRIRLRQLRGLVSGSSGWPDRSSGRAGVEGGPGGPDRLSRGGDGRGDLQPGQARVGQGRELRPGQPVRQDHRGARQRHEGRSGGVSPGASGDGGGEALSGLRDPVCGIRFRKDRHSRGGGRRSIRAGARGGAVPLRRIGVLPLREQRASRSSGGAERRPGHPGDGGAELPVLPQDEVLSGDPFGQGFFQGGAGMAGAERQPERRLPGGLHALQRYGREREGDGHRQGHHRGHRGAAGDQRPAHHLHRLCQLR